MVMHNQPYSEKKLRLAILTLHPIHYQTALWRRLAQEPDLDPEVWFCSDEGLDTADPVSGYGQAVEWGLPLLQGFRCRFWRNMPLSKNPGSFWCRVNPGVIPELRRGRYDALFVHSYHNFTQLAAILVARRLGTKVLVRSEPTLKLQVNPARRSFKGLLLPWLFGQVDACMAIGSLNREYYQGYGVGAEKIFPMPYAVDNAYFFQQRELWAPQRERLKQEYGIATTQVILYVGRFQRRKRVMDLIQAFENLGMAGVSLALVGTGEDFAACRGYVRERQLAGVHFLGFRNQAELPRLYALADVFVLPGVDEPWGLVINEAMCSGLPIVASEGVGAAADLIRPGYNGFRVPPADVPALTQALGRALADGARERLGQASLEIIRGWGFEEDVAALRRALGLANRGGRREATL
jgi:glycosyltransferase involved in cell wall biosynthesis